MFTHSQDMCIKIGKPGYIRHIIVKNIFILRRCSIIFIVWNYEWVCIFKMLHGLIQKINIERHKYKRNDKKQNKKNNHKNTAKKIKNKKI